MVIGKSADSGDKSLTSLKQISSICVNGSAALGSGTGATGSLEEEDSMIIGVLLRSASWRASLADGS